jgi:uncharacterized SAM-binding protein YcdF (DUF218 family)
MHPVARIEEPALPRLTPGHTSRHARNSRFFGLLNRKERWGFSWKGRLVVVLLLVGLAISFVYGAYPFLAVTHRVDTDVLVVEGWIHQYAIRTATDEFQSGHYQRVFTTGGPIAGMGGYTNDYNTSASVGAGRLKAAGLSSEFVQIVPSHVNELDRTYSAAVALRNWFREHRVTVHGVNVVTEDAHARRTRLLFQRALGNHIAVGVIAVPNPDYDAKRWWRYSEGVREVVSESVAYLYARLLFFPSDPAKRSSIMGELHRERQGFRFA